MFQIKLSFLTRVEYIIITIKTNYLLTNLNVNLILFLFISVNYIVVIGQPNV